MWYTLPDSNKQYPLSIDTVREIKAMNNKGIRPEELETTDVATGTKVKEVEPQFVDVVGQISLRSLERNAQKRKSKGSRDNMQGTRDQGRGTREQGAGNREKGIENREQGRGNRDKTPRPNQTVTKQSSEAPKPRPKVDKDANQQPRTKPSIQIKKGDQ